MYCIEYSQVIVKYISFMIGWKPKIKYIGLEKVFNLQHLTGNVLAAGIRLCVHLYLSRIVKYSKLIWPKIVNLNAWVN